MFDTDAQNKLQEQLEYEIWLLDYISRPDDVIIDRCSSSCDVIICGKEGVYGVRSAGFEMLPGFRSQLLEISPLIFMGGFKILDFVFVWILEINRLRNGLFQDHVSKKLFDKPASEWSFKEKLESLKSLNTSDTLVLPDLFLKEKIIFDYLFTLYRETVDFRHEIVHRSNFSVSKGQLEIIVTRGGEPQRQLKLNREHLSCFSSLIITVVNCLCGKYPSDLHVVRMIKYYLNQFHCLHNQSKFSDIENCHISLIFLVPENDGVYPANLEQIKIHSLRYGQGLEMFDYVYIIGLSNNLPQTGWKIPIHSLPADDLLCLNESDLGEFKIPKLNIVANLNSAMNWYNERFV